MHKAFFRELKPYSLCAIACELDIDIELAKSAIARLVAQRIVRYRDPNTSSEMDLADDADARSDEIYKFD